MFHYIKRTTPFAVSPFVKYNLLNACVLSVLLYGSEVWYPGLAMLQKMLSFHKKIFFWSPGCYEYLKGLEKLSVIPVFYQLIRNDVVCFSKLLNGDVDLNPFNFVSILRPKASLRSADKSLFVCRHSKKFTSSKNYLQRVVEDVNFLSRKTDIDVFDSPRKHKKKLGSYFANLTKSKFSPTSSCTWFLSCNCSNCRA